VERRDGVPYRQWVKKSAMEATLGEVIDYDRVRSRINELGRKYNIRQIAIDRRNATQLASQLDGDGFETVAFGNGHGAGDVAAISS
jgi:phage terminase large subunit-like protein